MRTTPPSPAKRVSACSTSTLTLLDPPSTTIREGRSRSNSVAIALGIASGRTSNTGLPLRAATGAPDSASVKTKPEVT